MTSSFAELGLSAKVLAAIEAAGYPSPTPIQVQAIPVATTGRDVLGIAQTGTGKTASFVLPMITRLEAGRARARMPRSLILAPTRELAAQVAQSFEKYGINHKLSVALLIGGVSMDDQLQKLDRGVDVLIATPGRLLDHFGRGKLMLMGVEILVIDEADRMLDMGFIPDIEKICRLLPPKRQTLFFSATMPPEITRLVDQFLKDPARIEVARPATTAKTITQRFRFCEMSEDWAKREVLRDLIRKLDVKNAIIFCNRKRDVAILLKSLTKHGFNAGALHGDMDQMSRTATLDKFRAGEITLLAASDVAARGLDIPDVSHIFNFDVPWQPEDYVHRIGRTGRAGREGYSATIVTPDDVKSMEAIGKLIGEEPQWLGEAPDEATLAEARTRKRGRGRGVIRGKPESRGNRRGSERPPRSGGRSGPRDGGRETRREETRRDERRGEAPPSIRTEPHERRPEARREAAYRDEPRRDEPRREAGAGDSRPRERDRDFRARDDRNHDRANPAPRDTRSHDRGSGADYDRSRPDVDRGDRPRRDRPERPWQSERGSPQDEGRSEPREPRRFRDDGRPRELSGADRDRPERTSRGFSHSDDRRDDRARQRDERHDRPRDADRDVRTARHPDHPRDRDRGRDDAPRQEQPRGERREHGRDERRPSHQVRPREDQVRETQRDSHPVPHRGDRGARNENRDKERPAERNPSRQHGGRGDGEAPRSSGLGEHVPAFLRRPAKV